MPRLRVCSPANTASEFARLTASGHQICGHWRCGAERRATTHDSAVASFVLGPVASFAVLRSRAQCLTSCCQSLCQPETGRWAQRVDVCVFHALWGWVSCARVPALQPSIQPKIHLVIITNTGGMFWIRGLLPTAENCIWRVPHDPSLSTASTSIPS
jgi:hypothetical protein